MSEWGTVTLADIADIRFSNVDKKSLAGEKSVRLCNYMDAYSNNYITADLSFMEATATASEMERFKVEKGDNIITKDSETPDDIGIPAVVIDDIPNLICGYHLALIKPKRDMIDPIYLSKQLGSKQSAIYFSRLANGSTRYGLSSPSIASIEIPLAPLIEQRRIADVLFTLDKTIEKTESLIAKYQQIKAGLMHDLFTRGVTADGKLRPPREQAPALYQETPIGWIPKDWEVGELKRWLSYLSYGFTNPMPESDEGPYLITAADVSTGRIQYDTCRKTTRDAFDRLLTQKSRPEIGDVLLTKDGTLGRVAIVDRTDVCINQSVAVLRPKDVQHSKFIATMLSAPMWQAKMLSDAGGSTIKHIYITVVDKMLVAWPKRPEELLAISAQIENCTAKVECEEAYLARLRQQKLGLMSDLLTGKVRLKEN